MTIPDDTPECDCCHFPAPVGGLNESMRTAVGAFGHPAPPFRLCDLCYWTMLGAWHEFPEQHDMEALEIMRHQSFVGNQIRRDLAARGDAAAAEGRGT